MPKSVSPYVGGFDPNVKSRRDKIFLELPDKIKCAGCRRICIKAMFSKRQLERLVDERMAKGPSVFSPDWKGLSKCRQCVGGQNVEMTCMLCNCVKGLDEFSKAQRRNPDEARCRTCLQEQLDAEANIEDAVDEEDISSRAQGSLYGPTTSHSTASAFERLSLSESNQRYRSEDSRSTGMRESGTESSHDVPGIFYEQQRGINRMASSRAPTTFTGYDANGNPHRLERPPSPTDSVSTTRYASSSIADDASSTWGSRSQSGRFPPPGYGPDGQREGPPTYITPGTSGSGVSGSAAAASGPVTKSTAGKSAAAQRFARPTGPRFPKDQPPAPKPQALRAARVNDSDESDSDGSDPEKYM